MRRSGRPPQPDGPAGGPGLTRDHRCSPRPLDPTRGADVAAILEKAAQPCWAITVRYGVTTAADRSRSPSPPAGPGPCPGLGVRPLRRAEPVRSAPAPPPGRSPRDPAAGPGDLVSVAELAALAHLPTDVVVAGLARAGAKAVAPPPAVADGRPTRRQGLGDAETGGRRAVALAVPDARHHLHVMGATGSGKSTLLTNLVLGDIKANRGVVVIDPKGDLVTDICARMPDGAEQRRGPDRSRGESRPRPS